MCEFTFSRPLMTSLLRSDKISYVTSVRATDHSPDIFVDLKFRLKLCSVNTVTIQIAIKQSRSRFDLYSTWQKLNKKARWCFVRHLCTVRRIWLDWYKPSTFAISFNRIETPSMHAKDDYREIQQQLNFTHRFLRSLRWQEFHLGDPWLPSFSLFANALFQ